MTLRVEWRRSVALTGTVLKYLGAVMIIPLSTGVVYGEDDMVFISTRTGNEQH